MVAAPAPDRVERAKRELRHRVLSARSRRDPAARERAGAELCSQLLGLRGVSASATVAAYCSTGTEPGTERFLAALTNRGSRILVPVLRPDLDLDWAQYAPNALVPGRSGILEPVGARLGVEAVATADVVVCPGVAGDPTGRRLGRGGGSYDRALTRVGATALRCLMLYDDEVVDRVPTRQHDQLVDVLVTPSRVIWASGSTRRHPRPEPPPG